MILLICPCRYQNNASIELQNAANEQQKITENRLVEIVKDQKNLKEEGARHSQIDRRAAKLAQQLTDVASQGKSAITTHILDTSRGRPASGVSIDLHFVPNTSYRECPHQRNWILLGGGRTNKGGRLTTLLPDGVLPKPGVYCLTFHVGEYFEMCREEHSTLLQPVPFYPLVNVYFTIRPDQVHEHFHVPLTWNPFGYSTYRGS